jgi:hypothetical protein
MTTATAKKPTRQHDAIPKVIPVADPYSDPGPYIAVQFDGGLIGAVTGKPWVLVNHLGQRIGESSPQVDGRYNPVRRFGTIEAAEKAAKREAAKLSD